MLKRYAADVDLSKKSPYRPVQKKDSGKKVAVIGTGPTGLSAAYYLLQNGHACDIYDKNPEPGGMLRYGVADEELPKSVLDLEIERIAELGATFLMERSFSKDFGWDDLHKAYDAVILAVGKINPPMFEESGMTLTPRGILIDRKTYQTALPGFFAGGNAVSESRMAIRAAAHGRSMALAVSQFLAHKKVTGILRRFKSMLGNTRDDEVREFLKEAQEEERIIPAGFNK